MPCVRLRRVLVCTACCLAVSSCAPKIVEEPQASQPSAFGSGVQVWKGGNPGWHIVRIVGMQDAAFVPSRLRIQKGTVIIWKNLDAQTHVVIGDRLPDFRGASLRTGESTTYLFDRPGTYTVHCGEHPAETGVIEVME